jgi:MFS family permease
LIIPIALHRLTRDAWLLFATRFIRLFAYGALSVVLVLYLVSLGLTATDTGLLLTSTLLGDTLVSLYLTTQADRIGRRRMLIVGAALMAAAGLAFAFTSQMWLLVIAGTIGVISPSGQEVGPFLPIEQAALSQVVPDRARTEVFAWYTMAGSLATALGALAAGLLTHALQMSWAPVDSYRVVVIGYACIGVAIALVASRVSRAAEAGPRARPSDGSPAFARLSGIGKSRPVVLRLSALFALDSFGGGFVVQSFAAYWFYLRFGVDPRTLGTLFFAANVFAGISALVASRLAGRIGLLNTMVVTHLPSNVLLILIPLMPTLPLAALMLLLRFSISQMDVPTRQSYTMAVVRPEERSAASGITGVARTTGAALSPLFAGLLFSRPSLINVPFFIAGTLKIAYDLLLYRAFRSLKPPEELTRSAVIVALLVTGAASASAQDASPSLRVGPLPPTIVIDGLLAEPVWESAASIEDFRQTDPVEGAPASARTHVRVLADAHSIVIGIVCDEADPASIVSFSVRRDAVLTSEDHIRIVLGPFADGRSGYVFAVNPTGARYDAIINPGGESDNPDWDGIWEAATTRLPTGWSAEIRIPVLSIAFKPGLHEWQFNVQRRIQRRLEIDRWASPNRQYQITQTSRAGLLTGLPDFDLGVGLTVRPAVTSGGGIPSPVARVEGDFQPSLDINQRLGANLLASATVNTDFAETEVDTRRTNLTRFPLFFPEKRTFFIEGDDIFSFGLGLGQDVIPYFSRRIGLVDEHEVPILAGGKLNGRIGDTNFGSVAIGTRPQENVINSHTFMGVGRVKRNLWRESWIGAIATVGDPLGRSGSWLGGADFTYATSRFRGDKNLLVGVWGLATGRQDLGSDSTAHGFKVDYPNDLLDLAVTYKRIGRDFDPSVGFVPRAAVQLWNVGADFSPRLSHGPIQQMFFEFQPSLATDLSGRWESYRVFWAPINWRFRSGDRVEFNAVPVGERLTQPFEVASGVAIAPGSYEWLRYRLEAGTAQKRRLYTQLTWWFGDFYNGTLDQFQWTGVWNPKPIVTVEFSGERNVGRLPTGRFTQTVAGTRLRVNISPDLSIASYIQYDTDSESVGTNTRLRWTFRPVADLFVVYNHNVRSILDRWRLDSNQLLIKLQYAFRM